MITILPALLSLVWTENLIGLIGAARADPADERGKSVVGCAALLKLGFEVAQSSVAKYTIKRSGPPSQRWRTFLRNHAPDIAATMGMAYSRHRRERVESPRRNRSPTVEANPGGPVNFVEPVDEAAN